MIRIGFTRWLIKVERSSKRGGMVEMQVSLIPQAKRYRVSKSIWRGLNNSIKIEEIEAETLSVKACELEYDLRAHVEISFWSRMADSLAATVVNKCLLTGMVDFPKFEIPHAISVVKIAIMKAVEKGESDPAEQAELIDLVGDMEEMRNEREARALEAQRLADEAMAIHKKAHTEGTKKSKELLLEYLTEAEKEEVKKHGTVTVSTLLGEFKVFVQKHGFIQQFVKGKHVADYCVVFADYNIPHYDEVLMKVLLLRSTPERLLKVANKFKPHKLHQLIYNEDDEDDEERIRYE